ncbi:MAG TPA: c-type cytochrome, partial [bacterium]|nr:c-type cytochrome [bacterium]
MARPGCTDSVLGASLACLLILHSAVCAQVPEEFTNLQVLPKEIAKDDLEARMREFTFALNVKCSHCHVGPDNLQDMDFASDEKPTKRTARVMMRMTDEINGGFLRDIETGRDARVEVKCQTCHHRVQVPEPIED